MLRRDVLGSADADLCSRLRLGTHAACERVPDDHRRPAVAPVARHLHADDQPRGGDHRVPSAGVHVQLIAGQADEGLRRDAQAVRRRRPLRRAPVVTLFSVPNYVLSLFSFSFLLFLPNPFSKPPSSPLF